MAPGASSLAAIATRAATCPEPDAIVAAAPTTLNPTCPTDHVLMEVSQTAIAGAWGLTQTALPTGLCGRVRDLEHVRCDDTNAGTLVATFEIMSVGTAEGFEIRAFTLGAGTPAPMQLLSTGEPAVSTAGCVGNLSTQGLEPVVLLGSDDDGAALWSLTGSFPPIVWPNLMAPADISARGRTTLPELFVPEAFPDHLSLSSHLIGVEGADAGPAIIDRQVIPILGVPWAVKTAHLDDDDIPDVVALFKIAGDSTDAGVFLTFVALGRMRGGRHIAALSLPRYYVDPTLQIGDLDGDCIDDRVVADPKQAAPTGEPSLIEVWLTGERAP